MRQDEKFKFDKRIIERNIDRGFITEDEYQEHLESLEDLSDQAAVIEAEFEVDVLEEDEQQQGEQDVESEEE